MGDLGDYDLGEDAGTEPPQGPPERRRLLSPVLVAGLLALAAAVLFGTWLFFKKPSGPPAKLTPKGRETLSASPSEAPPTLPPGVPPLDESDGFVRDLAKGLSADARFAAWLATRDLVRVFVVAVENVADGASPRAPLAFLAPVGAFKVTTIRGRLVIDPLSYARYDAVADVLASLDATACAAVYKRVEPLLDAGHREQGHLEGGFSKSLAAAAARLLATPIPEDEVPVRPVQRATLVYALEDEGLEKLSPAQKQLLRMGPRNSKRVLAKVRELVRALGLEPPHQD
jgi:DUF3014 family protein